MSTHRCDESCDDYGCNGPYGTMFDVDFVQMILKRYFRLLDEYTAMESKYKADTETMRKAIAMEESQKANSRVEANLAEAKKLAGQYGAEASELRVKLEVAAELLKQYEAQLFPKPEDSSVPD